MGSRYGVSVLIYIVLNYKIKVQNYVKLIEIFVIDLLDIDRNINIHSLVDEYSLNVLLKDSKEMD